MGRERRIANSRSGRLGIIGAAICAVSLIPTLGTAGTAATESGGFHVQAQDRVDPEIVGTAGMDPTPAVVPDSVVFSYSCGPMEIDFTESMFARSDSNWAAYSSGDYGAVSADPSGWAVLIDASTQQKATRDSKPTALVAVKATSKITPVFLGLYQSADYCQVGDWRNLDTIAPGTRVVYGVDKRDSATATEGESRLIEANGERFIEGQALSAGIHSLNRYSIENPLTPYLTDEVPGATAPSFELAIG